MGVSITPYILFPTSEVSIRPLPAASSPHAGSVSVAERTPWGTNKTVFCCGWLFPCRWGDFASLQFPEIHWCHYL